MKEHLKRNFSRKDFRMIGDRNGGERHVESRRGWQMPDFPCNELDLILNEMEQDLIYILKGSFSLLCGEWVRIGTRIEAGNQLRVIEVVQARIRMRAVEIKEVDIFGNIFWRQRVGGLTGKLDVTVQRREHSNWFFGYHLDQLGGFWCHLFRCGRKEENIDLILGN